MSSSAITRRNSLIKECGIQRALIYTKQRQRTGSFTKRSKAYNQSINGLNLPFHLFFNALCALLALGTTEQNCSWWTEQPRYQGNYSLKQAKLFKTSNERVGFPYNISSGLKSWEASLKFHAGVCFDQNWQSHSIFHQMLLLTDSLGLPPNPLHCVR